MLKIGLVATATLGLMAVTIAGAIWVSHAERRKAAAVFPKCESVHSVHKAVIEDNRVVPEHTEAKRCDTLTITNLDDTARFVAFGEHDRHVAYDGVYEKYLSNGSSLKVTLIQPGTFKFHDHIEDKAQGTFTVR